MEPRYASKNRYFPATDLLQRHNMPKMRAKPKNMGLTAIFSRFLRHFSIYKPYGLENSQEFQQGAAGYDPQLVAMHTHPHAARLSSTARGSSPEP